MTNHPNGFPRWVKTNSGKIPFVFSRKKIGTTPVTSNTIADTFARTSTTSPGSTSTGGVAWVVNDGTWGTDGGALYSATAADKNVVTLPTPFVKRSVTTKVQSGIGSGLYPGFIFAFDSTSRMSYVEIQPGGQMILRKYYDGDYITLTNSGSNLYTNAADITVDVDESSSSFSFYLVKLNGTEVMRYTDSGARPTGKFAGYRYGVLNSTVKYKFSGFSVLNTTGTTTTNPTTPTTEEPTETPTNPTTPSNPAPSTPAVPVYGVSNAARWWIPFGRNPHSRVIHSTGVVNGRVKVDFVGSMPDSRLSSSLREVGVPVLAQNGYQVYVNDLTANTTVADSGIVSSSGETHTFATFTPVAGRRYKAWARVRSSDGKWSSYAGTRFVAPSGNTLYLEDFGADPTGSAISGTDYPNGITTGPIRRAIAAAAAGDVITSRKKGTILRGVTSTGNSVSLSSGGFTSSMVGKKVLVYGGGKQDPSAVGVFRTTISSVASDGKSATLASSVLTNQSGTAKLLIDYAEYLTNHIDNDQGAGGYVFDGTGCVFTSNRVDSAGFRTTVPDVSYIGMHYYHTNVTIRGGGKNNNSGSFFIEGSGAVGLRFIDCYAEKCRDAGFLFYNNPSDSHVVDCTVDHSMADPFHVTGSAFDIQFIRNTSIYVGDDATANIGYRGDGDAKRPYNIIWENPRMYGQDWGRGLSFGGAYDCLATDVIMDRNAMAAFIIGSDSDQANTTRVQVRGFTLTNGANRRGQKPTYSQGSSTGSVIAYDPWLKILNSSSSTQQSDILLENGTVVDGTNIQIISYGNGAFADKSVIIRNVVMSGITSSGVNWLDDSTYKGRIDLRGITVPSGSTAASAPTNSNGGVATYGSAAG